jgi:membrane-bound lytic murein transglycosylase B
MPSTYLKYAVDEDGDGRRDIWGSVPDALGSTANYLKGLGWESARGWGQEVVLPAGFDLRLASLDTEAEETVKSVTEWRALGVRAAAGRTLPTGDLAAALILPAGIDGPAFLVHGNYRAILKFNRSTLYAISVGYLADRFGGGEKLAAPPRLQDPIPREDIIKLQEGLTALGFLQEAADGVAGGKTRRAVRAFQEANGLPPDGYIDRRLMAAVRAKSGPTAAS